MLGHILLPGLLGTEETMKRQWHVRREAVVRPDAQGRWDQAYQAILRWSLEDERGHEQARAPIANGKEEYYESGGLSEVPFGQCWRGCPKWVGGACGVVLRSTSTALFDPFWPSYASGFRAQSVVRTPFRTVSEGLFSEVRRSKRPIECRGRHSFTARWTLFCARIRRVGAIRCTNVYQGVATRNGATTREILAHRAGVRRSSANRTSAKLVRKGSRIERLV